MKKRIISVLLAACMVLSMLPISAYAVETGEEHIHNADCDHVHDDHSGSMWASNPTGAEADADGSMWASNPTGAEADADGSTWASKPTDADIDKFVLDESMRESLEDAVQIATGAEHARNDTVAAEFDRDDFAADAVEYEKREEPAKRGVTAYNIWINGTSLTSERTSVTCGGGTASYDPNTKTLTLNNITIDSIADDEGKAGIWCTQEVTIELIGTNTITLTGQSGGDMTGLVVQESATIKKAASATGTPSLVIKSATGTNNTGILAGYEDGKGPFTLNIQDVDLKITDESSSKGYLYALDFHQTMNMTNVGFTAKDCYYGIVATRNSSTATLKNVTFDISCYSGGRGLSFKTGTYQLENCSGTVKGYYPVESSGNLTIKNSNLTLTADGTDSNTAAINPYSSASLTVSGGKLTVNSANGYGIGLDDTAKAEFKDSAVVDITAGTSGLYIKNNSATVTDATVTIKAGSHGITIFTEGASFTLNSGSVTVTGTGSSTVGLYNKGSAYLKGGTFTTNGVYHAISNDGTKPVEITGGTQNLNNTYSGYASFADNKLTISGGANFTATGGTYGLCSDTSGSSITIKDSSTKVTATAGSGIVVSGSLSITGGTTKLTHANRGISTNGSSANVSLTGGTVNITTSLTAEPSKLAVGIYNGGTLSIGGTADVTVKGAGYNTDKIYGLYADAGTYYLSGGNLTLNDSYVGMYVAGDLKLSGTNIATNDNGIGIDVNATLTLSGGKLTQTSDIIGLRLEPNSTTKFAGTTASVMGVGYGLYAISPSSVAKAATWNVTGGSVTLYGQAYYAGNLCYSSLGEGYVVKAGSDETSAAVVSSPSTDTFTGNKYVRIYKDVKYTLTLVNVKGATSASLVEGEQFTYTAADAPSEKHFKQWTLTVGDTTTFLGTTETVTYQMPASDATLTAVYENCYGGTATCSELAHCTVCGEEYGVLKVHDFTGEVEDPKYLATSGDCVNPATYYYSCTMCGASCKGWLNKTFEGSTGMHSYTKQNPTADYLCKAADCENAATYYYSCSVCGASSKGTASEATFPYGDALGHNWGAWTSNGNGTHSRVCGKDSTHTETEDCSYDSSGICTVCGGTEGIIVVFYPTATDTSVSYRKGGCEESTLVLDGVYDNTVAIRGYDPDRMFVGWQTLDGTAVTETTTCADLLTEGSTTITLCAVWEDRQLSLQSVSGKAFVYGTDYIYEYGVLTLLKNSTYSLDASYTIVWNKDSQYVISNRSDYPVATHRIVCKASNFIDLTLRSLSIEASGGPAIDTTAQSVFYLTLEGTSYLTGDKNACAIAGRYAEPGSQVEFYGNGTLYLQGGENAEAVTAESFTQYDSPHISAIGGSNAAGIKVYSMTLMCMDDGATLTAQGSGDKLGIEGLTHPVYFVTLTNNGSYKIIGGEGTGYAYGANKPIALRSSEAKLYPLVVNNPDGYDVYVDGVLHTPSNHTALDPTDTNLYLWLTGKTHTVNVGGMTSTYDYDKGAFVEDRQLIITPTDTSETLVEGTDYTYLNGVLTIKTDKAVTIKNSGDVTTATDRIVIAKDVSANITLAGVNIDLSATGYVENYTVVPGKSPLMIADDSTGAVTINLKQDTQNTLKGGVMFAGINKNGTSGTLTINDYGTLDARGGYGGAGIGCSGISSSDLVNGVQRNTAKGITIESGNITAIGGDCASGIGGGQFGHAEDITISGGVVLAYGNASGIGSGGSPAADSGGEAKNITISGGTVTASGWLTAELEEILNYEIQESAQCGDGAGIGAAHNGLVENIVISGGSVNAIAGVRKFSSSGNAAQNVGYAAGCSLVYTPVNADGENVYPLVISNPNYDLVWIDGVAWEPVNHDAIGNDTNLYLWLTGEMHTVQVGSVVTYYVYQDGMFRAIRQLTITATDPDETLVEGTDYTYVDGVLTVLTSKPVTIKNSFDNTVAKDTIAVAKDVNADITLAGVNIDVSGTGSSGTDGSAAFAIADDSKGNVTIRLAEGTENTLKSGYARAGIEKNGSDAETKGIDTELGKLTITGTGKLTAKGGMRAAGIGSANNQRTENITIENGDITAIGDLGGAGIGSGRQSDNLTDDYAAWLITISGGTVHATGGHSAAGIGGGWFCGTKRITITGENTKVYATGGKNGPGIGSGYCTNTVSPNVNEITISDGAYVEAISADANGIGVGKTLNTESGGRVDIRILDATVVAKGGMNAIGSADTAYVGVVIGTRGDGSSTVTLEGKYCGIGGVRDPDDAVIVDGHVSLLIRYTAENGQAIGYGEGDGDRTAVEALSGGTLYYYVYPLTIANPNGEQVLIDGTPYLPIDHTAADPDDTNLYAWLGGRYHTVTVGDTTTVYHFDSATKTFVTNACYDNNADGLCDVCGQEVRQLVITSDETLVEGTDYTYSGGVLTVKTSKPVTIKNSDGLAVATDRIVVAKNVNANITLAGVNIDRSATGGYDSENDVDVPGEAALLIVDDSNATVTITLAEGTENVLKGGYLVPALCKNGKNGTLVINGTGSLTAQGAHLGAGIGSESSFTTSYDTANITIESGNITAIGGLGSAGIGTGYSGTAYNITVKGGTVVAYCGGMKGGAGIGGGQYGSLNGFTVEGGTVIAIGSGYAAGIGGGEYGGNAENIRISGGNVTAIAAGRSFNGGAGIGGGTSSAYGVASGYAKNITISGGVVLAYGESSGIGSGMSTNTGAVGIVSGITISGGTVTASGELTQELYDLLSGIVTASGAMTAEKFRGFFGSSTVNSGLGAGIGAAPRGEVENILISGGSVNAIGGSWTSQDKKTAQAVGYGYERTEEFAPVNDDGEKLYPMTIANPDGLDVYVGTVKWSPSNHKDIAGDTNLYLWLPGVKQTVTVGETETEFHFDPTANDFTDEGCHDDNGDCLCDLCGETCHHIVTHSAKAATCTDVGWDAYESCSECDYTTYREISALGHDPIHHDGQAATCTEKGWEVYDTCSRCDYTTYKEIDALGHDPIHHDGQAATCTEKGWEAYDTCSRCDYTTYKEIDALGHDPIHHDGQAATCTEKGWEAYDTCSRCDYTTYKEIDALGHDPIHHDGQAATCTEKGWEAYDTCSRCDYTTYKEIDALGHDPIHHDGQAATCTEKGWEAYDTCSRCDYTTYKEIDALGHDPIHHDGQAATCTEKGWEAYDTCSRCDYTTYKEIEALGHDMIVDAAATATCTEPGLTEGSHCSRCEYKVEQEPVAALGHDYASVVTDPTCTEGGYTTYTCSRCGDSYTSDETAALGHDYVGVVTDPTCTEVGYTTWTCSRCGDSYTNSLTAMIDHEYEDGHCIHCGAEEPVSAACPTAQFTDLSAEDWYHEALDFAVSSGLMNGMSATTFMPDTISTRAMVVTVLYRLCGCPEISEPATFADVPEGMWYSDAIAWAQDMGIVNGISETEFAPDMPVTREQLAAILWRFECKQSERSTKSTPVSDWAVEAMSWAVAESLFHGDENGDLNPTALATRAEFATIIMRYLGGSYDCPAQK